jgi:hypothetical protein
VLAAKMIEQMDHLVAHLRFSSRRIVAAASRPRAPCSMRAKASRTAPPAFTAPSSSGVLVALTMTANRLIRRTGWPGHSLLHRR